MLMITQSVQFFMMQGIIENGLYSAIPYLVQLLVVLGSGVVADCMRAKCCSTQIVRKLFTCTCESLSCKHIKLLFQLCLYLAYLSTIILPTYLPLSCIPIYHYLAYLSTIILHTYLPLSCLPIYIVTTYVHKGWVQLSWQATVYVRILHKPEVVLNIYGYSEGLCTRRSCMGNVVILQILGCTCVHICTCVIRGSRAAKGGKGGCNSSAIKTYIK